MATGSETQVDLSEGARLAQLRRIEELKGRVGDVPSWFNQKLPDYPGYAAHAYGGNTFPTVPSHKPNSGETNYSFTSEEAYALVNALNHSQLPDQSSLYGSSKSNANRWHGSNDVRTKLGNPYYQQAAGVDVGSTTDNSDARSQSQRMGSTPSKASVPSSNTSMDVPDVKIEADDKVVLDSIQGKTSPKSSTSSQLSPTKTNTPPSSLRPPTKAKNSKRRRSSLKASKLEFTDLRPRTSIPSNIQHGELARQSVEAAFSSRLNPFALHPEEYQLLRKHICHLHISAYLNIRNRILRLWVKNPLVSVTTEEAAGCAYSTKWLGLAEVAYEWLVRRGYINFGCVDILEDPNIKLKKHKSKRLRQTIVVVGAGMAGLGCARQLEGLFNHYREKWTSVGEEPPRVILLEGRARIGGRIYSHPLQKQQPIGIPKDKRCTAEMGAHIITGFDHGNPLNMIVRGQLALHYYPLKDNSSLYDIDGKVVDHDRDKMVEKLFNDMLERASVYRNKIIAPATVEGDRDMVEAGRDPIGDAGDSIAVLENKLQTTHLGPSKTASAEKEHVSGGLDKLTGRAHYVPGSRAKVAPALAAQAIGFHLKSDVPMHENLHLDAIIASSRYPTLGAVMDEAVKQYQVLLDLSPQDLRLLNWHFANLEYANAVNVGKLSLSGWDQDIGNEFEGEHAQVIGGYQQVPRGILLSPSKLDLRTHKVVKRVAYDPRGTHNTAEIHCDDGEIVEADHVVLTTPLGVLKEGAIAFDPPLPDWKANAIEHLGFGTLNKVILVFDKPFWDVEKDMIGLLRDSEVNNSLNQGDYVSNRGRFYLFWNCIKSTGRPLLIALMAGDAAHQAESLTDGQIVAEVTAQLGKMYKQRRVPTPSETIVTRWGKDRFTRGSYSYVGPTAQSSDYDDMAKPVGNLHFAGEATCGTHPATVHGAYISGLRAASEVIDDLLGPIAIPRPLVPVTVKSESGPVPAIQEPATSPSTSGESSASKQARLEAFEGEILTAIFAKLGPRPDRPGKAGANPFLLYSKEKWDEVKAKCDEARRATTGNANTKATRNEVRIALGQAWRKESDGVKRPYIDKTIHNRAANHESAATFEDRLAEWDSEAMGIRRSYVKAHPDILSHEEERQMWHALGVYGGADRLAKKKSGYADESGSDVEML